MKIRRPNQHFQIVAHRGLPEDYPENTLIAYRHALMLHIDMLEIDVHYTKDKELVVIHDDTIDRTSNGKGKVSDFTLKELKALDFGLNRQQSTSFPISISVLYITSRICSGIHLKVTDIQSLIGILNLNFVNCGSL